MAIAPDSFRFHLEPATGVATIVLDRPKRMNALTFEVYRELRETFDAIAEEPEIRAVVITGAGKAFCTGGDVRDIIGPLLERDLEGLEAFTTMTCDLVRSIRGCRRPVIAALNGTVAGAGAVIAAACDLRIAGPDARIAFLFTRVGLSGADMGICWLLPRIVGHGRASELLLTGDFIDAEEAARIGLYNRVVISERVLEVALDLAAKIAAGPGYGLRVTREALDDEWDMDLEHALREEAHLQAVCMLHDDFREAYDAFVAKREPRFSSSPEEPKMDDPRARPDRDRSRPDPLPDDRDDEEGEDDDDGDDPPPRSKETLH